MTDQQHPITPPPELVKQWRSQWMAADGGTDSYQNIATQAAQWGADQELEGCCEWVYNSEYCQPHAVLHLRVARRPKPPSLKEQALSALHAIATGADDTREFHQDMETIKTALEQLDD